MSVKDMIKSPCWNQVYLINIIFRVFWSLWLQHWRWEFLFFWYTEDFIQALFIQELCSNSGRNDCSACMVTLAISTNVVISLGMVGALSIVRFRTAVKDPMDLLYLFWAITTGITAGAGMYVLALIAAAIMILMIILFYSRQQRGKIYIAVIHYSGDEAGDEVIRCFGKRKYFIKSKTMRKEKTEMAVEIFCKQADMDFMEKSVRSSM